ncbi:TonB-dependent receptor [Muricauda sp. 2012CJ35-5]|uniref:TonB-dependent receptor n=1 Tax=Flagellimonas spongiicola TaxID=2942208 RepID=A0ABT0PQB5_9FLAO|nr:TonB-dependent receptor [Allomuricauda spongiicola]MCL6273161.1 TonB-dependent receptor [Allomuricauda spongiicola]
MKFTFSLYLIMVMQVFANEAMAQERLTLEFENTRLSIIMDAITEQSSYHFIYNNDNVKDTNTYNLNLVDEEIQQVLATLFQNTGISFTIRNKSIILSKKQPIPQTAQANFTLSGNVLDTETGETLLGASILVVGSQKGVVSNEYGFYSLTLPSGRYTLRISYIGYEQQELDIDLNSNQNLSIELQPTSNELSEVFVFANSKVNSQVSTVLNGTANISPENIKRLPALFGEPDVTRAVLTQPGVSTAGEGATGFNVRGGNIDQNLILLDEAPIYNSSHVWGFFSVVNTDAIKDLKLYKGGIPARFGGRASSVLEIRQREGSTKKFQGQGGLGLLFSRLTLEGPLAKEKVSYLISGRRSYFDLFFPLFEDTESNKVYFYDLNTKLKWAINQNNTLYASGYFGADVMRLGFEGDVNSEGEQEADERIDFRWKNATATLRWNHVFSEKLFMNASAIYSSYKYRLASQNTDGIPSNSSGGSVNWESQVENWIFKPDFTLYPSLGTKMRFGVNNTLYQFSPAKITSSEAGINRVDFDTETGLELAPYLEFEKEWDKFSINAGLRYSWFGNFGPFTVAEYDPNLPRTLNTIIAENEFDSGELIESYSGLEPRLSMKYDISDRKSLKLGYNRTFQYIHLISNTFAALPFDIWKPSGTHIKPLEVNQISGGYAYDSPNQEYNFSLEGYYKTFKNMVEYKNGADLFINENLETQLLNADGYSYGGELSIHKNIGKLTGNLNYAYTVTRRKTTSPFPNENLNDGAYYPSNYDRPHLVNFTGNYQMSKKWSVGVFATYQTGRPITQVTGRFTARLYNSPFFTYSDRNAFRIPDTHRVDLSFTYNPEKKVQRKWVGSWTFGVYNLYGHKNPFSTYSTFNGDQIRTFQFSVIGSPIPFITYNFKF